jgi:hypothetical protein
MKIALKAWMGTPHFLTKQLKNISAEISLHVLAYNMKRIMNVLAPLCRPVQEPNRVL